MPHACTEDQLVEQPAIGLFAELGWFTVSALEESPVAHKKLRGLQRLRVMLGHCQEPQGRPAGLPCAVLP